MFQGFNPPNLKLFFRKDDPQDPRLGEMVSTKIEKSHLNSSCTVILGYPDDEGVSLNGGRVGAKGGPDSIRTVFYKMTPSLNSRPNVAIIDGGNISLENDLNARHKNAEIAVKEILDSGSRVVSLGGGHDYGYSDLAAFCQWAQENKKIPFILNFDAHLDVRADTNGSTSGTSFFRLLNKYPKTKFAEVGIQDWCNSKSHVNWLKEKRASVYTLDEIFNHKRGFQDFLLNKVLKDFDKRKHTLAVSIDIDGFSSKDCPGASQVFPLGLSVEDFYRTWSSKIVPDFKPALVGIYEVNPTYDIDQRTAKVAAILMHSFVFK